MNKKEVSKRVLQYGKPIELQKFDWDEKTSTFLSIENYLLFDFSGIDYCTFKTGSDCTFKTGCECTFNTKCDCTFDTGSGCSFNTGLCCTFKTGSDCTFNTGSYCTFKTGHDCTFNTVYVCTFNTGRGCTFDTSHGCTFNTSSCCTFNADRNCTFDTGSDCTFKTGCECTFNTGNKSAVIRKDIFEVIILEKNINYQLAPYRQKGYLKDGVYSETGKKSIIADGILSEIISKKGNIYKVKNYNENKITYLIKEDNIFCHGETLKQAKDSLIYKISNRDTTIYKDWKLTDKKELKEIIKAYRVITGACESGTKYFCENNKLPKELTIEEAIELTKNEYNSEKFKEFFNNKGVNNE